MAKIDLTSQEWVDMVFEGRNQAYGAYRLRKNAGKRNAYSLITIFVAAIAIWACIAVVKIVQNSTKKVAVTAVTELSALNQPKKKAEVKQKQVKIEQPERVVERVKSSVKFTPPVIKKDDEVKPEEELKSQEDLNKTNTAIGSFDVKGNDEAGGEVLKAKEVIAQPEPPKEEETKIFEVVEQMPSFPGGQAALFEFLSKNIRYPVVAEENGIQGRVICQFVVNKDGSIVDVEVVRSGGDASLDKEAVRVIKSMPKWKPGKQRGKAVRVKYTVPVNFRLQ